MILRNASWNDCKLYFNWANDEIVRKNAIQTENVEWKAHQEWFKKKLRSENCFLYIAEIDSKMVGQIRFDCVNSIATIDYSISEVYRGEGFGKILVQKGIEKIRIDYNELKMIEALVKVNNIASNKIFLNLNFIQQKKTREFKTYNLFF